MKEGRCADEAFEEWSDKFLYYLWKVLTVLLLLLVARHGWSFMP